MIMTFKSKETSKILAEAMTTLSLFAQKGPKDIISTRFMFVCITVTQNLVFFFCILAIKNLSRCWRLFSSSANKIKSTISMYQHLHPRE